MTILMVEGFDLYGTTASSGMRVGDIWAGALNAFNTGRFGVGQALAANTGCTRDAPGGPWAGPNFSFCFAAQTSHSSNSRVIGVYQQASTTTPQLVLSVDVDGSFKLYRGGVVGTNLIATSSINAFPADSAFHYIEFTFTIDAAAGTATILVDGVSVLNVTGLNNRGGTTTAIGSIGLGSSATSNFDDFYVTDGASLGQKRIVGLHPSADTATAQWTPNSGSTHFNRVSETNPDGDTTYLSTSTVNNVDIWDMGDLSFTPTAIACVRLVSSGRKDDVATRTYRQKLVSGATTSNSADIAMTSSYVMTENLYPTDPNTGAAWGSAAINAMQTGIECRA